MNIVLRALVTAAALAAVAPSGTVPRSTEPPLPNAEPIEIVARPIAQAPAPRPVVKPVVHAVAKVKPTPQPEPIPALLDQVRQSVSPLGYVGGCGTGIAEIHERCIQQLKALDATAYPMFEAILVNPNSSGSEVRGVCAALEQLPVDRTHYVPFLVRRLADPTMLPPEEREQNPNRFNVFLRWSTAQFLISHLAEWGTARDAGVLVWFLGDENPETQRQALYAMSKIGGRAELEAINTWLTGQNHNDAEVQEFIKLRNEMDLRLEALPESKR